MFGGSALVEKDTERLIINAESEDISKNNLDNNHLHGYSLSSTSSHSKLPRGSLGVGPLSNMKRSHKLFICALGIFVCYFYFGVLQEQITRGDYVTGAKREKFTYTMALVFVQCIVNAIYAQIVLSLFRKPVPDTTKPSYYAASAFTYLTAMVTSNMALRHINYPTQVVGKSCKPIPVMVLGVLIGHKRYPLLKYLFVLTIVVGVAMFIYKDKGVAKEASAGFALGMGEILLLVSLAMDGLTGAVQERMRSEHQTKSGHMMLKMNIYSVVFLAIGLLATGELFEFVSFVNRYPWILYQISMFSVMSALGQFFIFLTVADFGPLPCSIITTTRKFFTVLGSVLLFGNVLSNRQWIGTAFVFAGLILDSIYGKGGG